MLDNECNGSKCAENIYSEVEWKLRKVKSNRETIPYQLKKQTQKQFS
jgi:hypothetical protein